MRLLDRSDLYSFRCHKEEQTDHLFVDVISFRLALVSEVVLGFATAKGEVGREGQC